MKQSRKKKKRIKSNENSLRDFGDNVNHHPPHLQKKTLYRRRQKDEGGEVVEEGCPMKQMGLKTGF